MENLEFRVFFEGKMHHADALDFCPTGLISVHAGNQKLYADPYCRNGISKGEYSGQPFAVMQDINETDSNDNPIFEKDILKIWMEGEEQSMYLIATMRNITLGINSRDSYMRITKLEILGNVYENPELLDNALEDELI